MLQELKICSATERCSQHLHLSTPTPSPHLFKLSINLQLAVQRPNPHLPNIPSYPQAIQPATPACMPLKWVIF